MKSEIRSQKSEARSPKFVFLCLLSTIYCLLSCSIPNLEDANCSQAKEPVKSFYSYHFGNEMDFGRENIVKKEKFLTPEFYKLVIYELDRQERFVKENADQVPFINGDPFTDSQEYPTSFRIGKCAVVEPNKVVIEVLMFWKFQVGSDQREMKIEVFKQDDKWLINDFVDGENKSLQKLFSREKYQ